MLYRALLMIDVSASPKNCKSNDWLLYVNTLYRKVPNYSIHINQLKIALVKYNIKKFKMHVAEKLNRNG